MTHRDHLSGDRRAAAAPRLFFGMAPEKALAWVLRGLGSITWILLLVIAWGIRDRMTAIDNSIAALSQQLGHLARTVESDGRASAGIKATVEQHDLRLVGLEQRVGAVEAKVRP
jgi:hypothetical protein